jgi:hypothetical protein
MPTGFAGLHAPLLRRAPACDFLVVTKRNQTSTNYSNYSQSTTSSASTPLASGIPTGAQPRCATFLSNLNTDVTVNNCLTALVGATDAFDPTTNTTISTVNTTAVNSALSTICSSSFTACPAASIRTTLTNFYTECSVDLLGASGDGSDGNAGIIQIYDVLYLILPLKTAICTKVNGKYCINDNISSGNATGSTSASASSSAPSPSASSAKRDIGISASDLFKRTSGTNILLGRQTNSTTQEALTPSADTYRNSGLPYLFLKPDSSDICSDCTYNVIKGYISFETVTPYAIGIAHSPMLKGQLALWDKIKTCPDDFATRLLDDATGTNGTTTSGSSRMMAVGNVMVGVVSVVGAAVALL